MQDVADTVSGAIPFFKFHFIYIYIYLLTVFLLILYPHPYILPSELLFTLRSFTNLGQTFKLISNKINR